MSYIKKVAELAGSIKHHADLIESLEKSKDAWVQPERKMLNMGNIDHYVVRKDKTVNPVWAGVQREAIKAHDEAIFLAKGKLEGLRYQLAKLGKEGGAA